MQINGVREDGRGELPSAIHKSGGGMGWQHPAGLPGPSTLLQEGLESRFSSIYYFFSLFFFFVIKTKKKNPTKKQKQNPKNKGRSQGWS